jgi:hypothetical protein
MACAMKDVGRSQDDNSASRSWVTAHVASNWTLFVGAGVYALLCMPAITERGYPPIDPVWHVFPFLWVLPLLLSRVLDTRSRDERWRAVAAYAAGAAFFDSGALLPTVVPKSVDFKLVIGMVVTTLVFFAPVHTAIAFLLEKLTQFCSRKSRAKQGGDEVVHAISRRRWVIFAVLLCGATALPFGIRQALLAQERQRGRTRAEEDWLKRSAIVYADHRTEFVDRKVMIDWMYDHATGLRLRTKMDDHGFSDAYNQRTSELVAENGVPDWSTAKGLIGNEELATLFESNQLAEIRTLPYYASQGIEVERGKVVESEGQTARSDKEQLWIKTKKSGIEATGGAGGPVFAGRLARFPNLVFIREGNNWLGVFHEDGYFLGYATKISSYER